MQRSVSFLSLCVGILISGDPSYAAEQPLKVNYNRDIRPILSDVCYACHGPDEQQRQAGLRLDLRDGAFAKLESGVTAIAPGKSAESAIVTRLLSHNPDEVMPPPTTGKKLTLEQIKVIQKWIDEGAEWRDHWSLIPPAIADPPVVKQVDLVANPIDRFILAKLERESLEPSPVADKVTLIRRLTLDLTGLPPTPAEVDAFLADASLEAYEKLVDRLLQSPRFGEHMARYWLDAVRYGDTHGLHLDNERSLWPFRDWVIQAFNQNMPFDQFTIEQIAGDLLPNVTIEQKIASGFNRCNVTTSEGGSIDEEVLVRYGTDRTEAVGTVWLGLTLNCCMCHDHKFDPITQKDFYRFYAFFNSAADAAMDGNALTPPPIMKLPTAEHTRKLQDFDAQLTQVQQQITDALVKVEYSEPPVVAGVTTTGPAEFVWIDDVLPANAKAQGNSAWEFVATPHPVFSGEKSSTRTADGLSQHFFTDASPGLKIGDGDKLFAYVYLDPTNPPKVVMLQWNDGSWEHRAIWGEDVIPWGTTGQPSRMAIGPLPKLGEWVRLEVEATKVGLSSGTTLNGWAFTQHGGKVFWDKAGVVTRTPQSGSGFESLLAWEAYETAQTKSETPQPVRDAIKIEFTARNDSQKKQIRDHFLEYVYPKTKPAFDPLHQQVTDLKKKRSDLDSSIPTTMVMADMPQPRETFVLVRGAYDKKADKVTAGVPSLFPPIPEGVSANRLALAKWLIDPRHPLTSRVVVNRFWQHIFGTGIVKTPEDFGSQGQWPTHPELLDWLARDFVTSGWNVQRLLKLMVMSHTYRQSSFISPQHLQRDPSNDLLARGPRFRLDAEVIRDSALFASGLLCFAVWTGYLRNRQGRTRREP